MNELELLLEYDEESLWDYYEPTNRQMRQRNSKNQMVKHGQDSVLLIHRLQTERSQRSRT